MLSASDLLSPGERIKVRGEWPAASTRQGTSGKHRPRRNGFSGAECGIGSFTGSSSVGSIRSARASSISLVRKRSSPSSWMDRGTLTKHADRQTRSAQQPSKKPACGSSDSGTAKFWLMSAGCLKRSSFRLRRRNRAGVTQTALTSILSRGERRKTLAATLEGPVGCVSRIPAV